ncbi:MAG: 4Fe-4S dicluster domain-containing protein [Bdellovibrio sp.]|uniref:4Fe-4S dicluster domain-containing protein n=1 Tax=Bdellovibrio sp. TaxID=28201 RepID=UPI0039E566F0|nr:4Fe-4S dicluster domain-containing protein [Bdellovibrio sp.]
MDSTDKDKINQWSERVSQRVDKVLDQPVERRGFLKGLLGTVGGVAAASTAAGAIASEVLPESDFSWEKFFQDHYKVMTAEDKEKVFARIETETKKKYGADVKVRDPQALDGVKFAYGLNLSKCNGSRMCVYACMKENNQSRDPQIQYIKVIEMDIGTLNLEKGDMYYEGESVPKAGKYYLPVQCHQCDNPPCAKVCPVEATWKEKDGIVVIDYDWCIGCRYCMAACPYEARRFNFSTPKVPKEEVNPDQGYLSNRMRPKGVVEKCHFCLHRTREGKNPACMEACPTGARKFGNILDPNSEVAMILKTKRVFVLKEELNTIPSFFYYFD